MDQQRKTPQHYCAAKAEPRTAGQLDSDQASADRPGTDGKDDADYRYHDGAATKLLRLPGRTRAPFVSSRLSAGLSLPLQIILVVVIVLQAIMLYRNAIAAALLAGAEANAIKRQTGYGGSTTLKSTSSVLPDYYQTYPEFFPGPTPTGPPAFLAQTNPAPFPGKSYVAPEPLETQVPIVGQSPTQESIFHLHGQLSHYFPNPSGFGVDEYSLPPGAEIVQLNMLSRHGSRYPTTGAGALTVGQKILNHTTGVAGYSQVNFTGDLGFLNTWTSKLGAEILTPVGKQELFDSGTLHQYLYGHLYKNNGTKIIARTTTQDRMLQSAEYFMAGFFGLRWTDNATLVVAIEAPTGVWNNTLAGYFNCPNSNTAVNTGGNNATSQWASIYLRNATARLNSLSPGFNWTVTDTYNIQSLCAYETVALGYSAFCGLFTYEEWEGYEYSVDINFAGNNAFQSPTGRAVGIGYVQEILARLQHHTINSPVAQINVTLDNNTATFPINQALNFDFSHDTNIMGILTAFGFTQFADYLPATGIVRNRSLIVSHMEPFGARLDIEVINTPSPLNGNRRGGNVYDQGPPTTYIHFILNQRTLPLGVSFPQCGMRDDGWCELETFLALQSSKLEEAEYEYSCFGKYAPVPYGTITNGVPYQNSTFTPRRR